MKNLFLAILVLVIHFHDFNEIRAQKSFAGRAEQYLHNLRDTFPNVAGVQAVVVRGDSLLFEVSSGFADVKNSQPFHLNTGLYIASNTKAFTGLAMMKLAEQGKIALSDPMCLYIDRDWFPDSIDVEDIVLKDLLAHTHGLSNDAITFRTAFAGNAPDSLLPYLLRFTSWRDGQPSRQFSYSNLGYLLSGMIIRKVTGMSWRDYLKDSLLIPAGLYDTSPFVSDYTAAELAQPYIYSMPGKALDHKKDNTMHAAGGLITTAGDMAKWLGLMMNRCLINNTQVLDPEIVDATLAPLTADTGRMGPFMRYGYAAGWIKGDYGGNDLYFHFGSYTGFGSMMSFMPEQKTGVFVFTNEGEAGMYLSGMVLTYLYDLLLQRDNAGEASERVSNMIRKTYSNDREILSPPLDLRDFPIKDSLTLFSEKYGTMKIYPAGNQINAGLGNLHSLIYPGEAPGNYYVQWTPGDPETLIIENTASGFLIRYEDYGVFRAEVP